MVPRLGWDRSPRPVFSATAPVGRALGPEEVAEVLFEGLEDTVAGEHVLVLVPDRTRNVPMAKLFPTVVEALHKADAVEVMVALGTHPSLAPVDIVDLVGMTGTPGRLAGVANHAWADPSVLARTGTVSAERLKEIAGPTWHRSLDRDLVVRVNRRALEVDRVVIVGPTLPHEVAGYSGGAKYLFPGISGPEMIDVMHWLGALSGVLATIGRQATPVRALIDEAAALLPTPTSLVALVTDGDGGEVAGIYAGGLAEAWAASVPQADVLHTRWSDQPYRRVISCPMDIYAELWTAGKAMYKLEPVVADGGELVIYAPHLHEVSQAHGRQLFEVGYHTLAYFLEQWDCFQGRSPAVLAHSSHVKGAGRFDPVTRTEEPRIEVRLASQLPADDCQRLNLGYVDPAALDLRAAAQAGTLVVPRSGEVLHRLRTQGGRTS